VIQSLVSSSLVSLATQIIFYIQLHQVTSRGLVIVGLSAFEQELRWSSLRYCIWWYISYLQFYSGIKLLKDICVESG